MACECITSMDEMLKEHGCGLLTTLFNPRVCVETYRLDTAKRGKKSPRVLATFCPFCGERYEARPDQSACAASDAAQVPPQPREEP